MPLITLTKSFLLHYEGSVFNLDGTIGVEDWDMDDRTREKQNYLNKRFYVLPDDGRGRQANLPLYNTADCPLEIFQDIDIKKGPCRITSAKEQNNTHFLYGDSKIILQDLCIKLGSDETQTKNRIEFSTPIIESSLKIQNRVNNKYESICSNTSANQMIDLCHIDPGFYTIDIKTMNQLSIQLTLIKLYPLILIYNSSTNKFSTQKTIW